MAVFRRLCRLSSSWWGRIRHEKMRVRSKSCWLTIGTEMEEQQGTLVLPLEDSEKSQNTPGIVLICQDILGGFMGLY